MPIVTGFRIICIPFLPVLPKLPEVFPMSQNVSYQTSKTRAVSEDSLFDLTSVRTCKCIWYSKISKSQNNEKHPCCSPKQKKRKSIHVFLQKTATNSMASPTDKPPIHAFLHKNPSMLSFKKQQIPPMIYSKNIAPICFSQTKKRITFMLSSKNNKFYP